MKYSKHRINVRTVRNMKAGDTLLIKHGKRVEYKGGYTLVPSDYAEEFCLHGSTQAVMHTLKEYGVIASHCKHGLVLVHRTEKGYYNLTFAHHFTTKNEDYKYWIEHLNYKLLES